MAAPANTRKQVPARRTPAPATANAWVERTLGRMPLDRKLGQLLMVYVWGRFTSTDDPRYQQLARWVAEGKVGGLIIEARRTPTGIDRAQAYPTAAILNQLQRNARVPLLVAADFETGTAMRLADGTSLPHQMAVAATGDPRDAYTDGRITAIEARAAGINWVFAPVSDVNNNPANPIINIRSYGEDPASVARFVTEFIRGAQANGVLATAKHFPGHGDTDVDSHMGLPVIPGDRDRLEHVELVPFRAAIAAGVGAVMTGHLLVPAFEPNRELPATLSPNIIEGLLRREMGFQGLIVTDALDMAAVSERYPPDQSPVLSIEAGADVLLIPPNPDAALEALDDAVRSGKLAMAKVDDAVRRVLAAKARLGLPAHATVDLNRLDEVFGRPEFAREALDIADRGVTLVRDDAHLLPLDATKPLRALLVSISADPDPLPGDGLEAEIRWRVDTLAVRRADPSFSSAKLVELPVPASYDVAIVAVYVRVADRKGSVGLPEDESALVRRVLASGKPAIVACFGSPYLVSHFPEARTWIAAFSTQAVAEQAMGRAIFGQVAIRGHLPVSVPGVAAIGAGIGVAANPMTLEAAPAVMTARLAPAFALLDRAVADRAFPGGVLAVGLDGKLAVHPFGQLTYDQKSVRVTAQTIYDVASLTKPVVTASSAMHLSEIGTLRLDAPVARYLPEWAAGPKPDWRAKTTVADLLRHSAGLPAHRDYYLQAKGYRAIVARALAEPLDYQPGTKIVYSDLDFMLLGEIVRRLAGEGLDRWAQEQLFAPLGMTHSLFRPAVKLRPQIAPTENDTAWRKRQLWGVVDDANAFAMGGVAGHAGLFSTAGDLAAFAQMILNGGLYAHRRVFQRATIVKFTARQTIGGGAYGLGWDVPNAPSSSGSYFSPASFGHTGFTGTSIWIDPQKDLFVILLTNRVYPTAANDKIRQVRPALHDAVLQALGLAR
ncbi:MAG TPA: glycoside hydrolase family 3 N-terminal domain-containing protein [Candidatus Acidoferrales bacterium]|nr:glycoside hydrolase family 3 N-terminal domain-containing protein [Candidatus Acidoferrales bacterium]